MKTKYQYIVRAANKATGQGKRILKTYVGSGNAAQQHANFLLRSGAAAAAARAASSAATSTYKTYGKRNLSFTSPTTGRTRNVLMGRMNNTAHFAGKIGGYRRPNRSQKRKYKKAFNGVQYVFERADTVLDSTCIYAEHCTLPIKTVAKYVVYTMLKKLLNFGSIQFSDWTELRSGRIITGDTFALSYKQLYSSATSTVISYTVTALDLTYGQIADKLWVQIFDNLINPAGGVFGMQAQALLQSMSYVASSGGHIAEINLRDASVSVMTKSSLKMQNRSYNLAADNEDTDINNVPLYGKSYEGSGNGFVPRDFSNIMVPCDIEYGWNIFGAGSANALREPPPQYHLQYARRSAKVVISPGKIRTSVLNGNLNMSLDRFFKQCYAIFTSTITDASQFHKLGKVRMFALERPIATLPGEVTPGVIMAVEHDFKGWIDIQCKKGQYTAPTTLVI